VGKQEGKEENALALDPNKKVKVRRKNYEDLPRHSFTRVSIAIQFTSQVLPPSVENDCSNLHDSGLMSEMMKRTRTGRPYAQARSDE
jgi:hypothetical protein